MATPRKTTNDCPNDIFSTHFPEKQSEQGVHLQARDTFYHSKILVKWVLRNVVPLKLRFKTWRRTAQRWFAQASGNGAFRTCSLECPNQKEFNHHYIGDKAAAQQFLRGSQHLWSSRARVFVAKCMHDYLQNAHISVANMLWGMSLQDNIR